MIVFATFTSTGYEAARDRIVKEVTANGRFDKVYTYNETELTLELLASPTFKIKKGLGHYSWKPDIIWQTLNKVNEGDIVVYLDAGCSVYDCNEWDKFFSYLEKYDILAFRLHQYNYKWTRKSVFDHFSSEINTNWRESFQYGANALMLKKNDASLTFVREWREYMIGRLDLCGDVSKEERPYEDFRLVENRYDQTIMTALLYKYMSKGNIKSIWEHFEGNDPFRSQAFKASRKRNNKDRDVTSDFRSTIKCIVKQYLFYPVVGNYILFKTARDSKIL